MKTIHTVGRYEVNFCICSHIYFIKDTVAGEIVHTEYMAKYAVKFANRLANA